MKKVLVAGTALMLAGSLVAQAEAGVNISGDARVTYVGTQDYQRKADSANGYNDYFESRVGLNVEGKGAADKVMAKARFYFDGAGYQDPAIWNGEAPTQAVTTDYAYLTAPLGDWTIKAGRINPDYSKFFSWNIRPTRLVANYKQGNVDITPFVGVRAEATTATDKWNDNDYMEYGLVTGFKLENGWNLKAYGRYDDDQREKVDAIDEVTLAPIEKNAQDKSGFLGDVFLNNEGANCDFGFHAEFAYKAADVQGTENDGMGSYVMLSKAVSSQFTPAVLAGMTKDGFMADNDFGFVMVGGNDFVSAVSQVGNGKDAGNAKGGDLLFGAFVANYKVSERLTLTGNLLYADYDNDAPGALDNAIEVSGVAGYALNESASLTYKAGYLAPSVVDGSGAAEDAYFGHLLRLNITF